MSMRCGMLLIHFKEPIKKEAVLRRLGFGNLKPVAPAYESGQIMSNADDHVVSVAELKNGWVSLWGRYDFNLLDDASAKQFVPKLTDFDTVIYYAVEGTSGALIYERYDNGVLTNSYTEIEGHSEAAKCIGASPKKKGSDQIDEWGLLRFALPPEVTFDHISETPHEHFQFRPAR
jgi:hypothetical protein